jgi:hypothetical protein
LEPGSRLLGPGTPRSVEPEFQAAFDALHAAVEDGEEDLARRILADILARHPPEHLEEFARAYERVLDGRQLGRELSLRLESEPVGGSAGDFRLVLVASHFASQRVVMRLPPAALTRSLVSIDAAGNEGRSSTSEACRALEKLVLPPGERVRVRLLDYELELAGALAVRERWSLEPRSGVLRLGERDLPAHELPVTAVERTRLASFLPATLVEPEELARALLDPQTPLPALIERAVRIDPERREEALNRLDAAVEELARTSPERLERAAPALRWLARTGRPGNSAVAWADWFRARRRERELARRALDVPTPEDSP